MGVERLRRWATGLLAVPSLTLGLWTAQVQAQAQPRSETLAACAACHGPGGNAADPMVPSLASQPARFVENQLVLIREGLRDIPVMAGVVKGLSDEEIIALARHYAAQPLRPTPGPAQPDKARRGAELSRKALCGTCHLPNYSGQMQVPRLARQHESYLRFSMKQFRDHPGPGRDTIMAASLYGLQDADLDDLAHYLARVKP